MIHSYSQQHIEPAVNARRTVGLAMVVLVHVGAILAIAKGTAIIDGIKKHESLHVSVITPEMPKPPIVPVEIKNPVGTKPTFDPQPPTVTTEPKETLTVTETPPRETIIGPTQNTATLAARIDPKHPLTQPAYPAQSRRMGEQGRVEMFVYVLPNGKIGEARIAHSSGYQRLDDAAIKEALRNWRLLPNEVDNAPVGSWVTLAITFRLTQ
jgi:periplasmic protein TonB